MSERQHHPDLYTPQEAADYLRLASVDALKKLRDDNLLKGYKGYAPYLLYHRDDLDRCALKMCGRDPDAGRPNPVKMQIAGER